MSGQLLGLTNAGWQRLFGSNAGAAQSEAARRAALVFGVDIPWTTEVGAIPGLNLVKPSVGPLPDVPRPTILGPNSGNYYVMSPGQQLANVVFNCGVRGAPGASLFNFEIRGWTVPIGSVNPNTQYALLDLLNTTTSTADSFTFEHGSIIPAVPSPAFTGIRGGGGTGRFIDIARVQDGTMVYGVGKTLKMEMSLFRRPLITNPDPTRADGDSTHADVGTQQEGGSVIYDGCFVDIWNPAVDGDINIALQNEGGVAGWMITGNETGNVSNPDRPQTCIFTRGWMRGGGIAPVNITSNTARLPVNGVQVTYSKIGPGAVSWGGANPYRHIARPSGMNLDTTGTVGWDWNTMTSTPLYFGNA